MAAILFGETISLPGYVGLALGILGLCFLELQPASLAPLLSLQAPGMALQFLDLEVVSNRALGLCNVCNQNSNAAAARVLGTCSYVDWHVPGLEQTSCSRG